MANQKHLSLSERILIESLLKEQNSFKEIGRKLNKDCTTISKEIRNHFEVKRNGCFGHAFNNCAHRFNCSLHNLCTSNCNRKYCKFCAKCHSFCKDYQFVSCTLLLKPPYVCNGCDKRTKCTLEKHLYSATFANLEYKTVLSESRSGIAISEDQAATLDAFLSPLISKGQSIHHICSNNPDSIMFSEKCIYNYVDAGIFSARNLDLPRKVKYRPRKSKHDSFKVDRSCRTGRTFNDYLTYTAQYPDTSVVQLDSVEGRQGGKVLLTIHFVQASFMLAFLRDNNDSRSVINVFEQLYQRLSPDAFMRLFPLCLADNGSEFSNPTALEFDSMGTRRSRIFYCDPYAPQQKGALENNHEFIRRILPKGTSFDHLTQTKVNLMMNHINSYNRKKLYGLTPYAMFNSFHGVDILEKLGAVLIAPNEIQLLPSLLK